ncbi:MAG: hypothetical protein KDJ38_20145, partial [Gammaproteobacteria bacterium]|nr:hypothetical protein [Gammaproteobacteria bacterium]
MPGTIQAVRNICLLLTGILVIASCTDTPRYRNPDACENDYYSELLGTYQGRIKAELWTSPSQTVLRNRCEWDVVFTLRSNSVGSGSGYCTIFADVRFTPLSQQNVDQGNYT